MRISDWSSDVCSSDLPRQAQEYPGSGEGLLWPPQEHHPHRAAGSRKGWPIRLSRSQGKEAQLPCALDSAPQRRRTNGRTDLWHIHDRTRKSELKGTGVTVRVDMGGRSIITKNKKPKKQAY